MIRFPLDWNLSPCALSPPSLGRGLCHTAPGGSHIWELHRLNIWEWPPAYFRFSRLIPNLTLHRGHKESMEHLQQWMYPLQRTHIFCVLSWTLAWGHGKQQGVGLEVRPQETKETPFLKWNLSGGWSHRNDKEWRSCESSEPGNFDGLMRPSVFSFSKLKKFKGAFA